MIKLNENAKSIKEFQNKLHEIHNDDIEKQQSFFYIIISIISVISIGLSIFLMYIKFKNICNKGEKNIIEKIYEDLHLENTNKNKTPSVTNKGKSLPKFM